MSRQVYTLYFTLGSSQVGRPADQEMSDGLNHLLDMLDSNCELISLYELQEQLKVLLGREEVYSVKTLQRKLQDRYGEHILFATVCGRTNVISFRAMASEYLNDKWYTER